MTERITLDLTADDIKGGEYTPAPEGWYKVEIDEVELKTSTSEKNPGKPFYSIKYNSLDEDLHKGKFFDNVMLWKGAHFSMVNLGKALGLIEGEGSFSVPTDDELLGRELEIFVDLKENTYKGETNMRNNVKKYRAIGGAAGKPAAKKTAKAGFKL